MTTLHTSAESLRSISMRGMAAKQKEVFDIVLIYQKRGHADMSLKEIQKAFEDEFGKRIDQVSSRVCELITAKRLIRTQEARACSVTGRMVRPVLVPAMQSRMFL